MKANELRTNGMIEINGDDDALFCNCKWDEAIGFFRGSWECYMELGKKLRTLKTGKHKGKFKEWCKSKLEFSYEWANILIKAYSRYELSEFTDEPQENLRIYADLESELSSYSEPETEENLDKLASSGNLTLADFLTKTPIIMSKKEVIVQEWIDKNPGQYDEIDREMLSRILPILKTLVKKYGPIAIAHMEELSSMIKSKDL